MQSSQSTVQVQRLYTRSPGTLAHRHAPRHTSTQAAVVSFPSHSHHIPITFPSPPSPACQYQNNNKQRDQYERDQYEQDQYEQDPLQDPLKYEHTAISHFLQWHSAEGARVPAFQRKGERSLSAVFRARAGLA